MNKLAEKIKKKKQNLVKIQYVACLYMYEAGDKRKFSSTFWARLIFVE